MADMKGIGYFPTPGNLASFMSFTNVNLDGSADKSAFIFVMPEDATITHVGFRYGARAGTPPTYITGLQGIDGSGVPDGTYLGGGSPASATFTPPADATWDGTWQWIALANSIAVSRGDYICVVIEYSSGTINGSNRSSFTRNISGHATATVPYSVSDLTGAWIKQAYPVGAVKSASKTYGVPIESVPTTSTSTSGQRLAMKFNVPMAMAAQYKVIGIRWLGNVSAGGSCTFGIWNAAGTALQDLTFDTDQKLQPSSDGYLDMTFDGTPPTLSGGVTYYAGLESDGTTVTITTYETDSSAEMSAFAGGAAICVSLWNGSAWVDSTSLKPMCAVLISDAFEYTTPQYRLGV